MDTGSATFILQREELHHQQQVDSRVGRDASDRCRSESVGGEPCPCCVKMACRMVLVPGRRPRRTVAPGLIFAVTPRTYRESHNINSC